MNRLHFFLIAFLQFVGQSGFSQDSVGVLNKNQFLGIELGRTDFKEASEILKQISYKEPNLFFRSIKWRDGGSSTLLTHHYFIKVEHSKLQVTLYGYRTVNRIRIHCNNQSDLSFEDLILGKSRIKDIEFTDDRWNVIVDANGVTYLTNDYGGIRVDIPGDSADVKKRNWPLRRLETITITKPEE